MANFDNSTPFMLLARIHVKPGCVNQYLELARVTYEAVQASEPGMLHHTFDEDPDDPHAFVWSEVYPNDEAFSAHVSNPPVQEYLQNMRGFAMASALRFTARSAMTTGS